LPGGTLAELLLISLLVALTMVPLLVFAFRATRPRSALLLAGLWLLVPASLTWSALQLRTPPVPEHAVEDRPIEAPDEGYVSSDTCEACHPGEYASWHRSYHRTMTQAATPENILGDFDGVHLEWKGRSYDLSIDDEAAWVELEDPGQAGSGKRVKRKVVMSTGSHLDQLYWLDAGRDDRLIHPFAFYHSKRLDRWLPVEAAYLADPETVDASLRPGDWNARCINCHTTGGTPRLTSGAGPNRRGSFDSRVVEFGIACEACHGPAEEHVRRNRDPVHRAAQHLQGESDGSIVNPANLDSRQSSRICGSCHSISVRAARHAGSRRQGFERDTYRPGKPGPDSRVFIEPRLMDPDYRAPGHERGRQAAVLAELEAHPQLFESSFWSDGMVRISGRDYSAMIQSPCYERGELACSSCHSMHKSPEDGRSLDAWAHHQVDPARYDNRACTQCHAGFEQPAELVAHTRHTADSSGSSCYNCHMPYTTYGMLKAIRSHEISSPSVQESVETGRPNACNLCHLDQTLAWTAERLEEGYGIAVPPLSEDERDISAGALWALRGEAGVRAVAAHAMGWQPAMAASGSEWMTPILSQLLADPYYAVRYIAADSLKKRERFANFEHDFIEPPARQQDVLFRARMIWSSQPIEIPSRDAGRAVLRNEQGEFLFAEMSRLLRDRDDTPVFLAE